MVEPDRERLGLALRRTRGRTLIAQLRNETAAALGVQPNELSFLDLLKTDAALNAFSERRQALETGAAWAEIFVILRASSQKAVGFGLDALRDHLGDQKLLLHRGASELCGAVELRGTDILDHVFQLIELDQESVLAADEDGDSGLVVEYVIDPIGVGTPTFKLLGWSGVYDVRVHGVS